MKISFNLKNPKAEVSAIRLIVTHKGKVYRKYTGISAKTKQWRRTKRDGQFPTDDATSDKLKAIRLNLERQLNEYSTEAEILTAIDRVLLQDSTYYTPMRDDNGGKPTFWAYFKTWSDREMPSKATHQNAYRLIGELMGTESNWNEVNMAYYYRLYDLLQDRGYSKNYAASIINQLKCVMSAGFKLHYHLNTDYLNFEQSTEIPDTIYLTEAELSKLWELDLSGDEPHDKARDLFLLGVYTAARFSDYSKLTTANIRGDYITFTQQKTDNSVMIPLSPKVKEILERNGGRAPDLTQAYFNILIKETCKLAGICDEVKVTKSKGRNKTTVVKKKYQLVSSHTARRTGATLLSQTGVSLDSLMLITGHKSLASIQHYLRLGKEENAKKLLKNSFFK